MEEFRITGGQLVASPFGTIRRPQGRSRRPLARHMPCAQKMTTDLREEGFSPESTVPMTMTVLSIRKEQHQVGPVCTETRRPGEPTATTAIPASAHTDTLYSPRTHTRRQFP